MLQDRITLTVPAKSEYAKTVRMTAAALATRAGMSYEGVDDVRMAVDEAFIYAVDSLSPESEVTLVFKADDETLEIVTHVGKCEQDSDEEAERRAGFAAFILDAVCESHEFVSDESGGRALRLVTRRGSVDVD